LFLVLWFGGLLPKLGFEGVLFVQGLLVVLRTGFDQLEDGVVGGDCPLEFVVASVGVGQVVVGVGPVGFQVRCLAEEPDGVLVILELVVDAAQLEAERGILGVAADGFDVGGGGPVGGAFGDVDQVSVGDGQRLPVGGIFGVDLDGGFGFPDGLLDEGGDVGAVGVGEFFLGADDARDSQVGSSVGAVVATQEGIGGDSQALGVVGGGAVVLNSGD